MEHADKKRRRDMWKNIPWERRAEIAKKIKRMKAGPRKRVLEMAFLEGLSTAEIAATGEIVSRNHRPMSKRRVLQIIAEEVPDYNAYQIKAEPKGRKDHYAFLWTHRDKKEQCGICGSTERLEWHHMIPVFLGGTADEQNMICLCFKCHKAVTDYQKQLFPEAFGIKKDA